MRQPQGRDGMFAWVGSIFVCERERKKDIGEIATMRERERENHENNGDTTV